MKLMEKNTVVNSKKFKFRLACDETNTTHSVIDKFIRGRKLCLFVLSKLFG